MRKIKVNRLIVEKPKRQKAKIIKINRRPRNAPKGRIRHQQTGNNQYRSATAPLGKGFNSQLSQPKFKSKGPNVTISHSEFVGTLKGSAGVSFQKFRVNPSDDLTFPWLSHIATAYEKYRIRSMNFRYVANCSSSTAGYVYMIPDYDVNESDMYDPMTFLNSMDTVQGSCWTSKQLRVRPRKPNQVDNYLIRSPYVTYNDYLLYDQVNIYVGTEESSSVVTLGKIFIDYTVELMIPDPSNRLRLDSFRYIQTGMLVREVGTSGNWLPVPDTSPFDNDKWGNSPIVPTSEGYVFTRGFCGYITVVVIGSGFDIGRVLSLTASANGQLISRTLDDQTGGTDTWTLVIGLNVIAGGGFAFAGNTTTSNNTCQVIIIGGSANPKWIYTADPRVPQLALSKKPKQLTDKAVVTKKSSKSLSKTKKLLEMLLSETDEFDEDSN